MFVDQVKIEVKAGDGGNGVATFRTEKYVPNGGPDGGDGGRGGSIVFEVAPHLSTLLDFRYKHIYKGDRGVDGSRKNCSGKNAKDLILKVPAGTMVFDAESGEMCLDVTIPGHKYIIARGGVGGRGNQHFATSVRQAPKYAENGEPGEERALRLDLKLLADVGLLGYPSVGKSTIIAAVSAAKPKIAEYHFTTLVPNLGVVYIEPHKSFVMADLPGLIEGAHEGLGLGHQFLRHVERTRILVHVLDVGGMTGRDPLRDYEILNHELELYDVDLSHLPQVIALNKIDMATDEDVDRIEAALSSQNNKIFRISAATTQGLQPLVFHLWEQLLIMEKDAPPKLDPEEIRITARRPEDFRAWEIEPVEPGVWKVKGKGFDRLIAMTNIQNEHAVTRLQRTLERSGVFRKLKELGAVDGDSVRVGKEEFDYLDDDMIQDPFIGRRQRKNSRQDQVEE